MRIVIGILLLASLPAFSADSDFNGRWDIKGDQSGPRAWWVELNGVGTPGANGSFISAFGGDLNKVEGIAVENGELRFQINAPQRPGGKAQAGNWIFRAKLAG